MFVFVFVVFVAIVANMRFFAFPNTFFLNETCYKLNWLRNLQNEIIKNSKTLQLKKSSELELFCFKNMKSCHTIKNNTEQ